MLQSPQQFVSFLDTVVLKTKRQMHSFLNNATLQKEYSKMSHILWR